MKKIPVFAALAVAAAFSAAASDVSADTTQFVTRLHDVEVVGVKSTIDNRGTALTSQITPAQVERLNIEGVRNIGNLVPNLFIPQYGSRMTATIYMRGMGSRIDQPSVGLNVDNVPYLNKDAYDFALADLASVEVLRGSAAVLNGRNSMAGQINVRTLSPWAFRGWRMNADFGRANSAHASAGWYGQLAPTLATSVTGRIGTTDGYWKNTFNDDDCGQERQASMRWKLSWHPQSRWSVSNTAGVSWSRQDGYPYQSVETGKIAYNDSTFYQRIHFDDALTASYTGRHMIATSVTSVQYIHDNMTLDQDFTPDPYFTLMQKRSEWAVSEDMYAKGLRGIYTWLAGVFGFYRHTDMDAPVTFKDTGISSLIEDNVNKMLPQGMKLLWDQRAMTLGSLFDISNAGFAIYHQSTVDIDNVTIQGGLRWDIEHVGLDYTSRCFTSATMYRQLPTGAMIPLAQRKVDIDENGHLSQTFNQLLPELTVLWRPRDFLGVRASVSKGYKAGGYNTQMFSNVLQAQLMKELGGPGDAEVEKTVKYRPEKAWTYEAGLSLGGVDRSYDAALTLFYISCRDQQLTIFPQGTATGRAMTNADRTRSMGVELTAGWRPSAAWDFRAAYGYTNATFRRYIQDDVNLRGKHLPYAPQHTLFASAVWNMPWKVRGFTASLGLNTRCAGKIYWDDDNTVSQKFYGTLGASLSAHHDIITVTLWGENLTNARYTTFRFKSIGHAFVQKSAPWTAGITLAVRLQR